MGYEKSVVACSRVVALGRNGTWRTKMTTGALLLADSKKAVGIIIISKG
jgi:hypothetical protein